MEETLVKSENYIVIQGWMITDLHLKGSNLIIYAIIYGFSQGESGKFTGSAQYLADWANVSRRSVMNTLKELCDASLIVKNEIDINGVKMCEYAVSSYPMKKVHTPYEKSSHNNIDNNIENTVSKDTGKKRKGLYWNCVDVIEEEFSNEKIKEELLAYLSVRIKAKDENGKPKLSASGFRTIIKEINELADTEKQAIDIIRTATANGYMKFYPVKQYAKKNGYRDNIEKSPETEEDILLRRYHEAMTGLLPEERTPYEEWRKSNG